VPLLFTLAGFLQWGSLAGLAAIWLLWPAARKLLHTSGAARLGLFATTVLGLILHLSMDAMNVYGVHPFAPFDPRWFYGDMIFIVEPRVPPRIFITIRRFARTYKEVYPQKICYT